ncbi:MAG TPA: response regulator transcription factor [Casimicrobiaceae bacterium]
MIAVAIADDHAIVRRGIAQIVSAESDMSVVGEASNYAEVMELVRHRSIDCLLLDISMPGRNGIDTLKQVKVEMPRIAVLVISMYPEDQYAFRAFKAGASGYLTKLAAADQLIPAIRQVARGRRYVTPELAEALVSYIDRDPDLPAHDALSDREFQTLRLIAAGQTLTQIGAALALSPKTVSAYRARLLAKLDLATNAELTRYALENKLVD